ncbi:MAG: hypothetical protein SGBAC_005054 [Bacillariaceae sp.]
MTLLATYFAVTQRICALNNHGVKSLQAGDTRRAEGYFTEAISLSRELIACSAQHLDENDFLRRQTKKCCCTCPSCRILPSTNEEVTNNPIFLYSRTLLLPQQPCHVQSLESTSLNFAVILFNHGLMNHMAGLNQENSHALATAEAFYELSMLLVKRNPTLISQSNDVALLLIAATGNNLAQIALEHGDNTLVRHRLNVLDTLLHCPNGKMHSVLTTVEWAGILSNVLLVNGLNTARAA